MQAWRGNPSPGIGPELRRLRQARGFDIAEAARHAGVARTTLGAWENDRRTPLGPELERTLKVLNVPSRVRSRLLAAAAPGYARLALASTDLGAPVDLGQILRAMRLRRGLTQGDLARAVGVGQGTMAKWESGDHIPSADLLHAALFALGASAEEVASLTCVTATEPTPSDPEAALAAASRVPHALREVSLLALENHFWWRAAHDSAGEEALVIAMSRRASWYRLVGRLSEVAVPARRAAELARTAAGRFEATYSLIWAADARLRLGEDPQGVVRSTREWRRRLLNPEMHAWTLSFEAFAWVKAGEDALAIRLARRAVDLAARHDPDEAWERRLDLAEVHLRVGEPEVALAELESLEWGDASALLRLRALALLRLRALALLRLRQEPPADWIAAMRAYAAAAGIGLFHERLAEVERAYSRFVRGKG